MRSGFWKADWFVGLAVVILFALSNWLSVLQSASRTPSGNVGIIAIDKRSIDNLGRWPWLSCSSADGTSGDWPRCQKGWYASSTASAATAKVDLEL